ncbi:MAG: ferritin family protein [Candidatus Bathyarchaeia archaeon]
MAKMKQESIADFLHCASLLEERAYSLYKNLADKVNLPLVNALLLHIAYDSRKHSVLLKGITGSIAKPKKQPKNYEKKLFFGKTWTLIENLAEEIAKEQRIPKKSLASLVKKLMLLESTVGQEYYILVQLKTLQYMTREIRETYNVDIKDLRDILATIIKDEEIHRKLLSKMKKILLGKEKQTEDEAPQVKYKSPDSWTAHIPAGIT